MTKVDYFKKFGTEICKHHSEHNEWKILERRKGRFSLECKKCCRERVYKYLDSNKNYQTEYRMTRKGVITRLLAQARSRSKKKNLLFELNKDLVFEQLVEQNNKCAYSNISFSFNDVFNGKTRYYIPSIDQIIAGKGYTNDNCVLVLSIVNRMKQEISLGLFKELCGYIYKT